MFKAFGELEQMSFFFFFFTLCSFARYLNAIRRFIEVNVSKFILPTLQPSPNLLPSGSVTVTVICAWRSQQHFS